MSAVPTSNIRRMDPHEKIRLRTAAYRIRKLNLPPAMAELVSRELLTWEEFGYRFGRNSLVLRIVDEIMALPTPEPKNGKLGPVTSAVGYD